MIIKRRREKHMSSVDSIISTKELVFLVWSRTASSEINVIVPLPSPRHTESPKIHGTVHSPSGKSLQRSLVDLASLILDVLPDFHYDTKRWCPRNISISLLFVWLEHVVISFREVRIFFGSRHLNRLRQETEKNWVFNHNFKASLCKSWSSRTIVLSYSTYTLQYKATKTRDSAYRSRKNVHYA